MILNYSNLNYNDYKCIGTPCCQIEPITNIHENEVEIHKQEVGYFYSQIDMVLEMDESVRNYIEEKNNISSWEIELFVRLFGFNNIKICKYGRMKLEENLQIHKFPNYYNLTIKNF
jgi:hypothetical protein